MKAFKKIRVRMCELDLTGTELAEAAGMCQNTLSNRLTGKRPWLSSEISAVARVLEIPSDQIGAFFFDDAPKSTSRK